MILSDRTALPLLLSLLYEDQHTMTHRVAPLFFPIIACAFTPSIQAQGTTHTVVPTHYYRTFSRFHPVLERVKPGDLIVTKTLDSGGQDERDVTRSEPFNPSRGMPWWSGSRRCG